MLQRILLAASLSIAPVVVVPPTVQAQECNQCENCGSDLHENNDCAWCFYGNKDPEHACIPYSCQVMTQAGAHLQGECDAALAAVRGIGELDGTAAVRLARTYDDSVIYLPERRILRVRSCDGSRIIAQFDVVNTT